MGDKTIIRSDPEAPLSEAPSATAPSATSGTDAQAGQRYALPANLDAAIRHLDDQQLDRLATAVLEERTRRRGPQKPKDREPVAGGKSALPFGKLNAVRAAHKAGVTPARIAREFGLSRTDVLKALAHNAAK